MARQDRYVREIDKKPAKDISGELITESISVATTELILPEAVDTLAIASQVIGRSASTPFIFLTLSWEHPNSEVPNDYLLEYAEDVNFTVNKQTRISYGTSAVLNLKPATAYWFRVAARFAQTVSVWSNVVTTTTIADTQVPEDVENVAASYSDSNLVITWDEPADEAYKDAEISIWNAARTINYDVIYIRGGLYTWTAERNLQKTSNVGLTNASIDVTARSWGNVFGTTITVTASQPVPDTPEDVIHTWTGDTGLADESITFSWNPVTGANEYEITIDGQAKTLTTARCVYTYSENIADHAGTPDKSLTFVIVAKNKLHQQSPAYTDTAVNAAPPSSAITMDAVPGWSSVGAFVNVVSIVQDFSHYEWTLKQGGSTIATYNSPETVMTFDLATSGTYDVEVKIVDLFGQKSTAVSETGLIVQALTIDELRAETQYTDSIGTSPITLNGLKDGNMITGVVSYAGDNTWRWTLAQRPLLDRVRTITYVGGGTGDDYVYFEVSDGTTSRYFAGPLTATGSTGQNTTLTEYASEALAKTNAYLVTGSTTRYDLPVLVEGRIVRVGHKATASYTLTEFYPRRMVESDDIRAEDIQGINVRFNTLTGNHISGTTLSAIKTSTGTLTIETAGYIRSGQTAYDTGTGFYLGNDAGTPKFSLGNSSGMKMLWDGTSLTFRTGASNQRIQIDSDGVSGYNSSNTLQVRMQASDGSLSAGAGNTLLDSGGITLLADTTSTYNRLKSLKWRDTVNSEDVGNLRGWYNSTKHLLYLEAFTNGGSTKNGQINIIANGTGPGANITLVGDSTESTITLDAGIVQTSNNTRMKVTGGLDIGTASGATTGHIRMSGGLNVNTTGASAGEIRTLRTDGGYQLRLDRTGTNAHTYGIAVSSSGEFILDDVTNAVRRVTIGPSGALGLFGSSGAAKQTVTGSKAGNAALSSLLSALSAYGLVTDSTT